MCFFAAGDLSNFFILFFMLAKHCAYLPETGTLNLLNASTAIANSTTTVGPQMPPFSHVGVPVKYYLYLPKSGIVL
jgi:hypothetical protein